MKVIDFKIDLKWRILGLLLLLSFLYAFWQHFSDPIQPIHECRKADSLSQAIQFSKEGSLFEPKTHSISNFGHREAAAEFPVIYFVIGQIWYFIGYHLWVAKLISLGYLLMAIIAFRNVSLWYFNSEKITLIFSGIIFSYPVLIYYSDTLLPDVFSFASLLLAGSFFLKFLQGSKASNAVFFALFLTLAVLIKITALIAVLSFVGAFFFFSLHQKNRIYWQERRTHVITGIFLISLLSVYGWYSYAISYNARFHSSIFSTSIRPIWEVDIATRWRIIKLLLADHLKEINHPILFIALFVATIVLALRAQISLFLKYWILIALTGIAAYFILWFWVFEVHDYYFIQVLFFPLTITALVLNKRHQVFANRRMRQVAFGLSLGLILLNTISFTQVAAGHQNIIVKNTFLTSQFIRGNWGWFYFNHQEGLKQIQDQTKVLQRIIAPADTVFCFSDPYPNIHLSTIDRIGFSGYGFRAHVSDAYMIRKWIGMGASKLLLLQSDTANTLIQPYLKHELYHKDKVFVYDLKPFRK